MVPLAEHRETEGFSAWSVKAGVVHAKPSMAVLEQMITLRVHLDDCTAEKGPLRLISGSHTRGELRPQEQRAAIESNEPTTCLAAAGDVLAMRPLVLHASSSAIQSVRRRVVHLEYARFCLPTPLRWPDWK
jgi:ectoine hydroxylase-related dioxygenase (phytanoyl-CoA dioxygenase family)